MAKPRTYPILYDSLSQICISKLKSWGYIGPEKIVLSTLKWSRNGNPAGSISLTVNTLSKQPYVELDYKYRDEPRNYKVELVSVPSNLGKGLIWYFLCPYTEKRCRKLYLVDGYFLHRDAFKKCMYDSQTKSKKLRGLDKTLAIYFRSNNLYSELHKKHFKKYYAGRPTKKYLRIMRQIEKAESIPLEKIKELFSP